MPVLIIAGVSALHHGLTSLRVWHQIPKGRCRNLAGRSSATPVLALHVSTCM